MASWPNGKVTCIGEKLLEMSYHLYSPFFFTSIDAWFKQSLFLFIALKLVILDKCLSEVVKDILQKKFNEQVSYIAIVFL